MVKTDIVMIEQFYAVRRQKSFLSIVLQTDFLDLNESTPIWRNRDYNYFHGCLSADFEKTRIALAKAGSDLGTIVPSTAILTLNEYTKMNKLAEKDEGMKDLLLKAKEYLILKKE